MEIKNLRKKYKKTEVYCAYSSQVTRMYDPTIADTVSCLQYYTPRSAYEILENPTDVEIAWMFKDLVRAYESNIDKTTKFVFQEALNFLETHERGKRHIMISATVDEMRTAVEICNKLHYEFHAEWCDCVLEYNTDKNKYEYTLLYEEESE